MALPTKEEAEIVVDTIVAALEATLLNNLGVDGFTLKLGSFGKFSIHHFGTGNTAAVSSTSASAVELGRRGGKARGKKLSKHRRKEIARLGGLARWKKARRAKT